MSDLTDDQILNIRRVYLRDEWRTLPAGGISQYNRAVEGNFFTNDQIKAIDDSISRDYEDQLDSIETNKVQERLDAQEDQADADTKGAAERLEGRFRLIAIECISQMTEDPGYGAGQTVKGSTIDGTMSRLRARSKRYAAWIVDRSGGIPIER